MPDTALSLHSLDVMEDGATVDSFDDPSFQSDMLEGGSLGNGTAASTGQSMNGSSHSLDLPGTAPTALPPPAPAVPMDADVPSEDTSCLKTPLRNPHTMPFNSAPTSMPPPVLCNNAQYVSNLLGSETTNNAPPMSTSPDIST